MRRVVVLVGATPPPVTGQAVATEAMFEAIEAAAADDPEISVRRCAITVDRPRIVNVFNKIRLLLTALASVTLARLSGAAAHVYLVADSGQGAYLSGVAARLLQLLARRLVIHHHGFKWIDRRNAALQRLLFFNGATHIALCGAMRRRLAERYDAPPTVVVSNAHIVSAPPPSERTTLAAGAPLTLGHLSNLTLDKGLGRVLDSYATLTSAGANVRLTIAGEPVDAHAAERLAAALQADPTIVHLGFVAGAEKHAFLQSIDVFLFPSLYAIEAEPIVVLEALAHGVPVIAYDQGCIGTMLEKASGVAFASTDDFAENATRTIGAWLDQPEDLAAASLAARRRFVALKQESVAQRDRIVAALLAP